MLSQMFTPATATSSGSTPGTVPTPPTPTTPPPPSSSSSRASASGMFTTIPAFTRPQPLSFTCTADACTGPSATDFTFRTLQNLINMANAQLGKKGFSALFTRAITIPVDGRITKGTLAAYLPVSRAVGGALAIFDFTPDIKFLATNAQKFALEIARWLGVTWVEPTATAAGHWENMRAGQVNPVLPSPPASSRPLPLPLPPTAIPPTALCPFPWMTATSVGCLYPSGTIATFSPARGKWRIAVTLAALQNIPQQIMTAPPPPPPPPPSSVSARAGFGWAFHGASHQAVAESDQPPQGVQQVDEVTFATAVGEPVAQPQPQPYPYPQPQPTQPTQPQPQPQPQPSRVDVGPTTVGPTTPDQTSPTIQPVIQPVIQPATPKLRYQGCIARFNKTRRVFSIYCPIGTASATPGLGIASDEFRCLYGNCGSGFGADAVTPPVPGGFTKVAETTSLPGAGETPAGEEKDKFFRANNPLMWFMFVGTAAAIGGGSYWLIRRRKVVKAAGLGSTCPKGQLWLESRETCVDAKKYWNDPQRTLRKLGPRRRR